MALSTRQASDLANDQQAATAQTIAGLLAAGDALKGDAQGRVNGGSQGYYTGGSGGYMVDNSPQVNAQANQIAAEIANIYGQAQDQIKAQAGGIVSAGNARVTQQRDDVNNSAYTQMLAGRQQVSDQQNALGSFGLSGIGGTSTGRATAAQNALGGYRDAFGKLNGDYFGNQVGFDLSRNASQADAFRNANVEQQKAIEAARQAALANATYWVPGSKGRYVSTYGSAGKKSDRSLISAIGKEQKAITSAAAAEAKQRSKDPRIRQGQVQANRRLN